MLRHLSKPWILRRDGRKCFNQTFWHLSLNEELAFECLAYYIHWSILHCFNKCCFCCSFWRWEKYLQVYEAAEEVRDLYYFVNWFFSEEALVHNWESKSTAKYKTNNSRDHKPVASRCWSMGCVTLPKRCFIALSTSCTTSVTFFKGKKKTTTKKPT